MNFYDLKPTKENVSKTLVKNLSERNLTIVRFIQLLNSINTSCSISLDGKWGSGKTFFVKQVQMLMDTLNGNLPEIPNKIKGIISDYDLYKLKNKQFCIYFDAWGKDDTEEPVLALIYEITKQYSLCFPQNNIANLAKFGKNILDGLSIGFAWNMISINSSGLVKATEDFKNNPVKDIEKDDHLHHEINHFFEQVLQINDKEKYDRVVIFIDELDRCRPTFALKLLERIKHYFDHENITFVFSTNMKELGNTVKAYYGLEFDAERYLDKFFDLRLQLPQIDIENYIRSIPYNTTEFGDLSAIFSRVAKICGLEMREITRFIKIYEIAANKYYGYFDRSDSHYASKCRKYVLPLLIGLKMTDKQKYEDLITGHSIILFEEFLKDDACLGFFNNRIYSMEECDKFYNAVLANDDYLRVFRDCLSLLSELSEYGND